jgi:metallo-beta-lactamase class B
MIKSNWRAFLLLGGAALALFAQQDNATRVAWNRPVAPFQIIGNIYYVGAEGVASYLITTPRGSILLDSGLPETAPQVEKNIATLGFKVKDVKFLLNSHAHYDHCGGLAELKRVTGAQMVASRADGEILERGGPPGRPAWQFAAVKVDRFIKDGETVELGGTRLTAVVTPGHTPGCTTWTMPVMDAGKRLNVVFYCSTSVVERLHDNKDYPAIVSDYQRSFERLKTLPCDVFLGPHPGFFHMDEKLARMKPGAPNPFIDPAELHQYVLESEQAFEVELKKP